MGAGSKTVKARTSHTMSPSLADTPEGIRSKVDSQLGGDRTWGQAFSAAVGNTAPGVPEEVIVDGILSDAANDGWGGRPDPAAFLNPDTDYDIDGLVDQMGLTDRTISDADREEILTELLLDEVGSGADYWEALAAAQRYTEDTHLIHDVLVAWDQQTPHESDGEEDWDASDPDPDFDYQAYYERN